MVAMNAITEAHLAPISAKRDAASRPSDGNTKLHAVEAACSTILFCKTLPLQVSRPAILPEARRAEHPNAIRGGRRQSAAGELPDCHCRCGMRLGQ